MADINMLQEYNLNVHGMLANIKIFTTENEFTPLYEITYEGVSEATRLLLLSFRRELLTMVPIDPSKLNIREYSNELNRRYVDSSSVLIDKYLPGTDEKTKSLLIAYILNMMLGLGDLEVPLADDNLEEIAVNGSNFPIWVFHKLIGWCKTNVRPLNEESIYDQAARIGRNVGRDINLLSPLMDASLVDGSRVNATLFPVSQTGNTITIRKFGKNPWTMPAMIKNKTISSELAALVWLCIQNEINILITGGTASGKTSFLNASSIFFPAVRRVVSVEETRELSLPDFLQWIAMAAREPNPEGKGEVTLYNLMINALRQRPDIMVVGEVRTSKDAETLFEAIHTGHAVYATLHADNVDDTIVRMTNPPINAPKVSMNGIGLIVSMFRHRALGIRRILEVGEMLYSGDASVLYRWDQKSDSFITINEMSRLSNTLITYGGYTKSEIQNSLSELTSILNWMVANNIATVNDAGFVVANYYKNKKKVLDLIHDNTKFSRDIF